MPILRSLWPARGKGSQGVPYDERFSTEEMLISNLVARRAFLWWNIQLVTRFWCASSLAVEHGGRSPAVSTTQPTAEDTPRPRADRPETSCWSDHWRYSALSRADITHAASAFNRLIGPHFTGPVLPLAGGPVLPPPAGGPVLPPAGYSADSFVGEPSTTVSLRVWSGRWNKIN